MPALARSPADGIQGRHGLTRGKRCPGRERAKGIAQQRVNYQSSPKAGIGLWSNTEPHPELRWQGQGRTRLSALSTAPGSRKQTTPTPYEASPESIVRL